MWVWMGVGGTCACGYSDLTARRSDKRAQENKRRRANAVRDGGGGRAKAKSVESLLYVYVVRTYRGEDNLK